ncbi:MAG: hypothetical protein ACJAW0_000717 [Zhongshania sp.]
MLVRGQAIGLAAFHSIFNVTITAEFGRYGGLVARSEYKRQLEFIQGVDGLGLAQGYLERII